MRRVFYLLVLCSTGLWAQEKSAPPALTWSGALSKAQQVLREEPEQEPEEQRADLNSHTSKDRSQLGFWLAAIELELQEGNPQIALGLVQKALKYHPSVQDLEHFRVDLSAALHAGKALGSLLKWSPTENSE